MNLILTGTWQKLGAFLYLNLRDAAQTGERDNGFDSRHPD